MKRLFYISILLLLVTSARGQIITTVAGNGVQGYAGDSIQATSAELSAPYGVAADAAGNVFIADRNNNRVRRVAPDGVIYTYAGSGAAGYSGDGGVATAARLRSPMGVMADNSGNLYIADNGNNCIRKINNAGIISTIAGDTVAGYLGDGGQATAAQLSSPTALAKDDSGDILIADMGNNCIRSISRLGIIATIAGTGTPGYTGDGGAATLATLYGPAGITVGDSNTLYIADCNNNVVRRVSASRVISTIAGTGTPGYSGDAGPATAAMLNRPWSVVTDQLGNIVISDMLNQRLRSVSPQGGIRTIAGTGVAGYGNDGHQATAAALSNPAGLAAGPMASTLYVADLNNQRVRQLACGRNTYASIAGPNRVCLYDTASYYDSTGGGHWGEIAGWFTVDSAGTITGQVPGYGLLLYTYNSSCGVDSNSKYVFVNIPPYGGVINGRDKLCLGTSSSLIDTTSRYVGRWSVGDTTVAAVDSGMIRALSLGTTLVSYIVGPDTNGCYGTSGISFTVISSALVVADYISPVACNGLNNGSIITAITGGSGNYGWAWSDADTAFSDTGYMITGLAPGTYSVTVTDSTTLCSVTDSFVVTQPQSLLASATTQNIDCNTATGQIAVAVSGGNPPYSYLWQTGDTTAQLSGLSVGAYGLTITDQENCALVLSLTVADSCNKVIVHDVITPNGDGINDSWIIDRISDYPGNTVEIYDNAGAMLYKKTGYDNNWTGRGSDGRQLPDGTYYYLVRLNAANISGGPDVFKGALLIKR